MDSIRNLVILGAGGDLSARLLLPGLGTLLKADPARRINVIGADREQEYNFAEALGAAFRSVDATGPAVEHTRRQARYLPCDVTDPTDLTALLQELEGPSCLYFALPPRVSMKALALLADLGIPEDLSLALEKPLGHDLDSARELNQLLARLVPEERTFRVDHFLTMPAVLNFLGLRFANRLLEPLLNREHVAAIEIVFEETLGLEGRAGFYDRNGAFRDMIQSHLLQVMALVMMDPPATFDRVELPALSAHILRATRLWPGDPADIVRRGRYTAGRVDGRDLPDYTAEEGVDPENETETFAQVTLEVDSWRWNGVPVTLRSAKAIGRPRQEILIRFHRPPHEYAQFPQEGRVPANVLRMGFDEEQLQLELNMGGPFDSRGMTRVTAQSDMAEPGLSAYGGVMRGILDADPTFSVRGDAAEEGWRITGEILRSFRDSPLREYPAGSSGL